MLISRPRRAFRPVFSSAVANNISIGGVLNKTGRGVSGTNYRRVHNMSETYSSNISLARGRVPAREDHSWTPRSVIGMVVERSTYTDRIAGQEAPGGGRASWEYACAGCVSPMRDRPLFTLGHLNGVGDDNRSRIFACSVRIVIRRRSTYCAQRQAGTQEMESEECRGGDSNPHGFPHACLRRARTVRPSFERTPANMEGRREFRRVRYLPAPRMAEPVDARVSNTRGETRGVRVPPRHSLIPFLGPCLALRPQ